MESFGEVSQNKNIFRQGFHDLIEILTEPSRFFNERIHTMSFNHALVFGLVTSWVAKLLEWITRMIKHESLMDSLLKVRDQLQQLPIWKALPADIWMQDQRVNFFSNTMAEALQITIHPIQAIIRFFVLGIVYWVGARVLVQNENPTHDRVTIANLVKIISLSSATNLVGAVLGFLPLSLGSALGYIYHVVVIVIGLSVYFHISKLRAFALYILPAILILTVFACLIFGVVALFALLL